jgi:hypothetical protein
MKRRGEKEYRVCDQRTIASEGGKTPEIPKMESLVDIVSESRSFSMMSEGGEILQVMEVRGEIVSG